MAYRKESSKPDASKQWRHFVLENTALFQSIGFPLFLQDRRERFDQWLMHGYHPEDHSTFSSRDLDQGARLALLKLIELYLDAGFRDPGIMILSNDELARMSPRPPFANHMAPPSQEQPHMKRKKGPNA